jgi:hypothetical protein
VPRGLEGFSDGWYNKTHTMDLVVFPHKLPKRIFGEWPWPLSGLDEIQVFVIFDLLNRFF